MRLLGFKVRDFGATPHWRASQRGRLGPARRIGTTQFFVPSGLSCLGIVPPSCFGIGQTVLLWHCVLLDTVYNVMWTYIQWQHWLTEFEMATNQTLCTFSITNYIANNIFNQYLLRHHRESDSECLVQPRVPNLPKTLFNDIVRSLCFDGMQIQICCRHSL